MIAPASPSAPLAPPAAPRIEPPRAAGYARPAARWTRTDTERWLNDRNAPLLAWLVRAPAGLSRDYSLAGRPPIRAAGSVLRDDDRALFDRIHAALAKAAPAARDTLHLSALLP